MLYSQIKEVYSFFQEVAKDYYGEFTKVDIMAFIEWLESHQDLKAVNWNRFEMMPYDMDEFFEEYKEENGFSDEEIESQLPWHYVNENKHIEQEYFRNVI